MNTDTKCSIKLHNIRRERPLAFSASATTRLSKLSPFNLNWNTNIEEWGRGESVLAFCVCTSFVAAWPHIGQWGQGEQWTQPSEWLSVSISDWVLSPCYGLTLRSKQSYTQRCYIHREKAHISIHTFPAWNIRESRDGIPSDETEAGAEEKRQIEWNIWCELEILFLEKNGWNILFLGAGSQRDRVHNSWSCCGYFQNVPGR